MCDERGWWRLMNTDRAARVGVLGAGKFGSMFLAQAATTRPIHVVAVADLSAARAASALRRTGWPEDRYRAASPSEAARLGTTYLTPDAAEVIDAPEVDVILEVTGDPVAGARHAVRAIEAGKHIVMVNVEADCLVGPLLAEHARAHGVVYSLAYGDQPALICELVDRVRASGFGVVAAGKGTKYLPEYHRSTPDTVWEHYGFSPERVAAGDYNARMFNSFLDGTKSAIEMAAVANAAGLGVPADGLAFPPCGADRLAATMCDTARGGVLDRAGVVEVVSSLHRDGTPVPNDLRWGVYVTFEAHSDYARACFDEYGVPTDPGGSVAALYRPYHLIGLELGVSVASIVAHGEPTGEPRDWAGDVVAVTKRDARAGEELDGEGGYLVHGRLVAAADSVAARALPIGLARGVRLRADIPAGQVVSWDDVEVDDTDEVVRLRRRLEQRLAPAEGRAS
ncbi:NAD(P)H-dependent oxidoreductase [Pseudonocardia acaciae]|uniref:NAD(P)H-dependent oxidoreductase n=1 Tax=Pseudonocardia acaciae TaxID=551276 RepID=UPI000688C0E1|nr:SAF domain-containing protein [Pseudonocardia acaciae]